ncbi:CRAL/TRIO domain-containing protein [Auriscalpium vulgare]|uniref:CRAL/TRIO domain-containing protein n=1 Tax=Auriscalpium vulgare TaxID=40419 RepID=A0ACB8S3W8_9AGAM|nr:CRAL/TRIO domain-containing protein [Auriscalpium vulgare]
MRARNFNVKQAKQMILAALEWRRTTEGVGIDALYRQLDPYDFPEREEVFRYWPMWFHKPFQTGRPLNIQALGSINLSKLYKHVTPERHWQTILVNAESLTAEVLPAASAQAGRTIEQALVVVDLKGYSLSQFWQMKWLAHHSFDISQEYFPETMGQLVVINAPSSFTAIWSIIKPWLSAQTVAKISIYGQDYKHALLDLVDAENLPESLGGKCNCVHVGGCHIGNEGPWMVGRAERRARWLRGELDRPGVQWPVDTLDDRDGSLSPTETLHERDAVVEEKTKEPVALTAPLAVSA